MEPKGKAKVKERKDNVSTKSQNLQKNSGQADHGISGQINPGKLTPTMRADEKQMTGTQQSRVLEHQEQLKNLNMLPSVKCDFRILVLPITSKLFWILPSEPSHFGIDTAACKTVVAAHHPAARGYLVHKDSLCAYSTAGRDKVYDQRKRILCTLDETGKPIAIESRKVNCRRPLMAVTEMTDCGRWVCFGPQRQGFSFYPRTGQKIEFTPTPGEWDLTMKLEPPERGNEILNKANQVISAKERAVAVTRDKERSLTRMG